MQKSRKAEEQKLNRRAVRKSLLLFCCFVLLLNCAIALPAYAILNQGGDILGGVGNPVANKQEAIAMAMDSNGNVFVTGYSFGTEEDYYTVKFNSAGNAVVAPWPKTYGAGSGRNERAVAIAIDSGNNVIVTGIVEGALSYDIHTIKYDNSGGIVWQDTYDGIVANGDSFATSVAVDSSNNVYVGGRSQNGSNMEDFLIIKYTSAGVRDASFKSGTADGIVTFDGAIGNDGIESIAVLSTGTGDTPGLAVTGYSWNGTKNFDCTTIKFNHLTGALKWKYVDSMDGDNRGKLVHMDSDGNVIMAGYIPNSMIKDKQTDRDMHVVKLDKAPLSGTDGKLLWEDVRRGGFSDDEPRALFIDASNNVYLAGNKFSIDTSNDFLIIKYNSAGVPQWDTELNTTLGNDEIPTGITVNSFGEVLATGYTRTAGTANEDFLTAKFSAAEGDLLWYKTFNSGSNLNERAVGISSPAGAAYVAGWSEASVNNYDYYAIKYDAGIWNRPTELNATASKPGASWVVNLTWNDNSITGTNELGFCIDRCTGDGCDFSSKVTFTVTPPDTTSYQDTTVASGQTYQYRIYAYYSGNCTSGNHSFRSDEFNTGAAKTKTYVLAPAFPTGFNYIYDGGANDKAASIAAGPDLHPVVTGTSYLSEGGDDYYTIKLNRGTFSPIWERNLDPFMFMPDQGVTVSVNNDNNVIVSGSGSIDDYDWDIATYGYLSSGAGAWEGAVLYDSGIDALDYPVATAVDSSVVIPPSTLSNRVAVTGYARFNKFGRIDKDIFLVLYENCKDSEACQPIWGSPVGNNHVYIDGGYGDDTPTGLVFDSAGDLYVSGYVKTGGTADSNNDFYFAKIRGTTGVKIWEKILDGTGRDDRAMSIDIGPSGDVYVTGYITNASSKKELYTVRYDKDGVYKWSKTFSESTGEPYNPAADESEAVSVKVDPINDQVDDGIVVGGTVTKSGEKDFYVIRYEESTGGRVWEEHIQNPGISDVAVAMAINPSGDICIAGDTGVPTVSTDILAVKLPHTGEILSGWATKFYRTPNYLNVAKAVAANAANEIFVAGTTNNAANKDYVVFKCLGDSIVVPTPFNLTPVADNAANNQKIKMDWNCSMYTSSPTFTLTRNGTPLLTDSSLCPTAGSPYTDTGLTANTRYCYQLVAKVGSVTSRSDFGKCRTTTLVPPAIDPLTVTSETQIIVSWTNVTDNLGYKLERCSSSAANCVNGTAYESYWSSVQTDPLAVNQIGYTDSGRLPGTTYYYRLRVYNIGGLSNPSTTILNATTVPNPPSLSNPGSITTNSMSLSWAAASPASGSTNYTLQISTDNVTYNDLTGCVNITGTTCGTGATLLTGTRYYFRVKARNNSSAIWSSWSNIVNAWTLTPTPTITGVTIPAGCSSSGNSSSTATISWNDVGGGRTGYYIEYAYCIDAPSCSSSWYSWYSAGSPGATDTSFNFSLTAGYAYRFRMYSKNGGNVNSSVSNERAVWSCMAAVNQSAITPVSDTSLRVNWGNINGNTAYDIQRRTCTGTCTGDTCSGGSYANVTTGLDKDATSWQDPGPLSGSYTYKVRAYNTTNLSGTIPGLTAPPEVWSNERCLATPPPAPNTVTLTDVQANQITVNWQNQGGGQYTGYVIERSTATGDNPANDATSGWGAFLAVGGVKDPFFETTSPQTYWPTAVGSTSGATFDTAVFFRGAKSFKLYRTTALTIGRSQSVAVVPGATYKLAGFLRTNLTGGQAQCDVQGTGIDSPGIKIVNNDANDTDTWKFLTETVVIPAGTTSVNVRCFGDNSFIGTAYFDDIQLLIDPGTTSYIDTGLTAGYGYKYRVFAAYLNTSGQMAYTAYTTEPYSRTIPATPAFSSLVAVDTYQITLTYNNVTGNNGIELYWKFKDGSTCADGTEIWRTIDQNTYNGTTYTHNTDSPTNRPDGSTFCYQIRSYTNVREGSGPTVTKKYSDYSAASTRMTLLGKPTGLVLTVVSATEMYVDWDNIGSNDGYKIERNISTDGATCNGTWTQIATRTMDISDYTDSSGLSAGTLVCYRVYTKNGEGNYSVASDVASKTTTPAPPVSLSLNVVSPSQIDISWQVTKGATKYRVTGTLQGTGTIFTQDLNVAYGELYCGYYPIPTTGCTTLIPKYTSTSNTGLKKNTEYCYTVQAANNDGPAYSLPSSQVCAKTVSMNAPWLISVTAPTSRQIDLLWSYDPASCSPDPCETADGFEVEGKMRKWHWINKATVPGPSATTYSDKAGIDPSTLYTYRVRAYKLAFNDNFTTINPAVWTAATNVPSGYGTASVTSVGGKVRLSTSATASGTGTNYSRVTLVDPDILSGDFDMQVDYTLPNGQISEAGANRDKVYARMVLQFIPVEGSIYYVFVERSISNPGGSYQNIYKGSVIGGSTVTGYLPTSDTSGKLRITKNGSTMTMYAWTNGEWYVLNSTKDPAFLSTARDLKLTQNVAQGQTATVTADLDNFKLYTKSIYSNERSVTTPVWQGSHDQCQ